MTIKELKERLNDYDENEEVVFLPYGNNYVYSPTYVGKRDVRKFFGNDNREVVIYTEQVGSI